MTAIRSFTEADVRAGLRHAARKVPDTKAKLDALYAERDAWYERGLELGMTQVQMAEWAGSTPEAVGKVLKKRLRG